MGTKVTIGPLICFACIVEIDKIGLSHSEFLKGKSI